MGRIIQGFVRLYTVLPPKCWRYPISQYIYASASERVQIAWICTGGMMYLLPRNYKSKGPVMNENPRSQPSVEYGTRRKSLHNG